VLSHLPTAVRTLGLNEGFPWYEPFGEVPRVRDLASIASYIDNYGPEYLLLEDPATSQSHALPNLVQHQREIRQRLTSYRFEKAIAGWLIYERL
jgi:hypothetical protein